SSSCNIPSTKAISISFLGSLAVYEQIFWILPCSFTSTTNDRCKDRQIADPQITQIIQISGVTLDRHRNQRELWMTSFVLHRVYTHSRFVGSKLLVILTGKNIFHAPYNSREASAAIKRLTGRLVKNLRIRGRHGQWSRQSKVSFILLIFQREVELRFITRSRQRYWQNQNLLYSTFLQMARATGLIFPVCVRLWSVGDCCHQVALVRQWVNNS